MFITGLGLKACITAETSKCMGHQLSENIVRGPLDSVSVTGCPHQCTNTAYRVTQTENPAANTSSVRFYVYFKNGDFSLLEETVMYDLNAIVAGVGGSLGLFLAFSCRAFLVGLLEKVAEMYQGTKHVTVKTLQHA